MEKQTCQLIYLILTMLKGLYHNCRTMKWRAEGSWLGSLSRTIGAQKDRWSRLGQNLRGFHSRVWHLPNLNQRKKKKNRRIKHSSRDLSLQSLGRPSHDCRSFQVKLPSRPVAQWFPTNEVMWSVPMIPYTFQIKFIFSGRWDKYAIFIRV